MKMALHQGPRTLEDLLEARELVEMQVIDLACERFTDTDMRKLKSFVQRREASEAIDYYRGRYDFEFEQILGDMCANKYLAAIQKLTHILWEDAMLSLGVTPVAIVDALQMRDKQRAKECLLYHLKSAQRQYQELIGLTKT
jgi:DNA-binding FadR family transcriptional regulator